MSVCWTIDVDRISNGEDGIPSRAGRLFGRPTAELRYQYRVKDADGNVYYEGRCTDDSSFAPLDWAQADAGATDIEYWDDKMRRWVGL